MFDLYVVETSTNLTDWARPALLLRTNNNPSPLLLVIDTCRTDSRVECAAIWDGDSFLQNNSGLQKPFLAALGQTNLSYGLSQWLFNKAITNAVLLQVRGADHITGADGAWLFDAPWNRAPALSFDACLVWFFDTFLKGETPPFPTNPEIYNVQRK